MSNNIFLAVLAGSLVSIALAAAPQPKAEVTIQVNEHYCGEDAIVVLAPTKVSASAQGSKGYIDYSYEIENWLPYEVFVQVSTGDTAFVEVRKDKGNSVQVEKWFRDPPETTFRLLKAANRREPSDRDSTNGTVQIKFAEGESLHDCIGWTGNITFHFVGYRRSDGEEFSKDIEVPIQIRE